MQAPIKGPAGSFEAINEAAAFHPFDASALGWEAGTDAANHLGKLKLGLTYRVKPGQTAELWAPARGSISFILQRSGQQFISRTLVLTLDAEALEQLRMGGREQDVPTPQAASAFPWDGLDAMFAPFGESKTHGVSPLQVRLLFTVRSEALDSRLLARLALMHQAGTLVRLAPEDYDFRIVDGRFVPVPVPAQGTVEQRLLQPWWDGVSASGWRLKGAEADHLLVELQADEAVEVHAQVRGGFTHSAFDHWFACNVGVILRALRVAGDPAEQANDAAYLELAGNALGLVSSGVDVVAELESPSTPPTAETIVVVHGGSRDAVVLHPPSDSVIPGALYSFTSAEDVKVFSRRFMATGLGLRLWQPTYTEIDLHVVKSQVFTATRNSTWAANQVEQPAPGTVMLTSEYGHLSRKKYPEVNGFSRERFLDFMEAAYSYDGARARPPEAQPPYLLAAGPSSYTVTLNALPEVRPEHPAWMKKLKDEGTVGLVRRLFPLRLEVREGGAAGAPVALTVCQDEVDCVRQEYVFHLRWADYFQAYTDVWTTVAKRQEQIHPTPEADPHHITYDAQQRPLLPALGKAKLIKVPTRREVRPLKTGRRILSTEQDVIEGAIPGYQGGLVRYRYTRLVDSWPVLLEQVAVPMRAHVNDVIRILDALDQGQAVPSTGLPPYAVDIVTRAHALITGASPAPRSVDDFLGRLLLDRDALTRLRGLGLARPLQVSSGWRPPEHNESVSTTPASNHQLGEAMDVQPRGAGPEARNPLALLCLHVAAQGLIAKTRELLLENSATEFFISQVDEARRHHLVVRNLQTTGSYAYVLYDPGTGAEEVLIAEQSLPGEPITSSTRLDVAVAERFRKDRDALEGASLPWPTPPPTYLDVYLFALCTGSHVHFTWNI